VNYSECMKWHSWIQTATRRILLGMDPTMARPTGLSPKEKTGSRTIEANKPPPMTDCSFRADRNSEETNMSSLTSTTTREGSAEKADGIMKNKYAYGQEQMDKFDAAFENKEAMFDLDEDEDVREKTTPREGTPENDIESTCGVVTESEETLERDGIEEKVRKEHGKNKGVYISNE
jgi:hypothetical protein